MRYEIKPTDCKNKSETKLPLNPKIFLISELLGNIKFDHQENMKIVQSIISRQL